jgi:hypothetical protein
MVALQTRLYTKMPSPLRFGTPLSYLALRLMVAEGILVAKSARKRTIADVMK